MFSLVEEGVGRAVNVSQIGNKFVLRYPCKSQTSCTEYKTTLNKGRFLLEVWGGEGGSQSTDVFEGSGGKGGYSKGILTLSESTEVFISIGAKGTFSTTHQQFSEATFGGGGKSNPYIPNHLSSNGGGGTDIRVLSNKFSHRIIVGGGGGTGIDSSRIIKGGNGGGLNGNNGVNSISNNRQGGYGGSQTSGGAITRGVGGSFGIGGYSISTDFYGCGGGGGWFGGSNGFDYGAGGGGGSGYVLTQSSDKPPDNTLTPKEAYFLEESDTQSGDSTFDNPFGEAETGHSGFGFAKITFLTNALKAGNCSNICRNPLSKSLLFVFISFIANPALEFFKKTQ